MEKWSCERVVPIAIPSGNSFLLLPFLLSPPISPGHRHAPTDSLYAVSSDPPPGLPAPWLAACLYRVTRFITRSSRLAQHIPRKQRMGSFIGTVTA